MRNIGLMMGLIILLSTTTKAQDYYTSYGYAQNWYLPDYVQYSITNHYDGYDIAHVQRYLNHGYTNFNVLLHRNGWFVELRVDNYGHIYKTIRHRWHYPLTSHVCTAYCGYHQVYYTNYYPKYHHTHYYAPMHSKTVYVTSKSGHKTQNNYYSNVYVNQPKSYDSGNNHNQQKRSNTVIRKPQTTTVSNVGQQRSGSNNNTARIQRNNIQERYTRPVSRTEGTSRSTNYRNERGSRNR